MKYRIGVLLTGCGAADGSDPQEVICLQLAIERAGHKAVFLSLEEPQLHVVDHLTLAEEPESPRIQAKESARLVRGKLHLIQDIAPAMFHAVIVPGGQGVAKNLMTSFSGSGGLEPVNGAVREFLLGVHNTGGTVGFISLAEFLGSALFGPWPEGKGCLDLAPGEQLVDPEKGSVLTPGNLNSHSLLDLEKEMERFLAAIVTLIADRTLK